MPLLCVIVFIYPVSKLVSIVEEKELRLKDLLLTMILHPMAYKMSYALPLFLGGLWMVADISWWVQDGYFLDGC